MVVCDVPDHGAQQSSAQSSALCLNSQHRFSTDTHTTANTAHAAETVLALMRNPDYCVYGWAKSKRERSAEDAETAFNNLSLQVTPRLLPPHHPSCLLVGAAYRLCVSKKPAFHALPGSRRSLPCLMSRCLMSPCFGTPVSLHLALPCRVHPPMNFPLVLVKLTSCCPSPHCSVAQHRSEPSLRRRRGSTWRAAAAAAPCAATRSERAPACWHGSNGGGGGGEQGAGHQIC
jgi:hypothetical protein